MIGTEATFTVTVNSAQTFGFNARGGLSMIGTWRNALDLNGSKLLVFQCPRWAFDDWDC